MNKSSLRAIIFSTILCSPISLIIGNKNQENLAEFFIYKGPWNNIECGPLYRIIKACVRHGNLEYCAETSYYHARKGGDTSRALEVEQEAMKKNIELTGDRAKHVNPGLGKSRYNHFKDPNIFNQLKKFMEEAHNHYGYDLKIVIDNNGEVKKAEKSTTSYAVVPGGFFTSGYLKEEVKNEKVTEEEINRVKEVLKDFTERRNKTVPGKPEKKHFWGKI